MNHKRKRPKNARAGCLMCKPNKMNGGRKRELGHRGFGKLRKQAHADDDERETPNVRYADSAKSLPNP